MAIAELRREYKLTGLRREDLAADPLAQFRRWFDEAAAARTSGRVRRFFIRLYKSLLQISGVAPMEVNAMMLATVDPQGRPSARVVLLRGWMSAVLFFSPIMKVVRAGNWLGIRTPRWFFTGRIWRGR